MLRLFSVLDYTFLVYESNIFMHQQYSLSRWMSISRFSPPTMTTASHSEALSRQHFMVDALRSFEYKMAVLPLLESSDVLAYSSIHLLSLYGEG